MATISTGGVVVWEWQNEYGQWRPYNAKVSTFIESHSANTIPMQLGMVEPSLYQYVLDAQNMFQVRQGTGTKRKVRRSVYPSTSPLAKGIAWQWDGDVPGRWNDYDVEVAEFLEDCFMNNKSVIDLSKSKFGIPYIVDLQNMTQKRIETGRSRKIQRNFTHGTYPLDTLSNAGGSSKRFSSVVSSSACSSGHKRMKPSAPVMSSGFGTATLFPSSGSAFPMISQTATNASVQASNPFSIQSSGSVGGMGTIPGPLTRQRYNNALSGTTAQSSQSSSAFMPVSSSSMGLLPQAGTHPGTHLGNHLGTTHPAWQPNFMPYGGGGIPNMSVYSPLGPISTGGLVGGQMPGSQGFGASLPPSVYGSAQHGHLLPQPLISGRNVNSRIRPSQQGASSLNSIQIPSHRVIRNYEESHSKKSSKNKNTGHAFEGIIDNISTELGAPPPTEDCCICYEKLIEASGHGSGTQEDHIAIQLEQCSHMFHKLCLKAMYDSGTKQGSLQCPSCKTIYGQKTGNCPRGEMEYRIIHSELDGHPGCKTIQILYHIHSDLQGPEHPHPGKRYTTRGFPRVGYLPDCDKGRKVLLLLIEAWKRRLTFTIGTSTTTGEENTVTWNEIHHKTELHGNYSGHGYPDPNYLDNVMLELATHGITEKDLPPT